MKKKINLFDSKTNSNTKMNKRKRVVISKKIEVLFSLFIKNGANINQANNDGITPLFVASHKGNVKLVSLLLNHGASVNQAAKDGYTPLDIASENNHVAIVSLILKFTGKLIYNFFELYRN